MITINEHSSIRIEGSKVVYFDPFKIPKECHDANYIFVTHSHFDHFSPNDIFKIINAGTILIMPESMEDEYKTLGIENKVVYMKPGEDVIVGDISAESVASYNTNKPNHLKENGWLGYIVTLDETRYYVCGDMDDIPEGRYSECDVLFVPIGGTYTMDYKEAAEFTNAVEPNLVIPTHYGSIVGSPDLGIKFVNLVDDSIDTKILVGI